MCLLAYLYHTRYCSDIAPVYTFARVCLCLCSYLLASMSPPRFIPCCPDIVSALLCVLRLLMLALCFSMRGWVALRAVCLPLAFSGCAVWGVLLVVVCFTCWFCTPFFLMSVCSFLEGLCLLMTTHLIDADTPNAGAGGSVIESTSVGVDATFVDVWCPGVVASPPSGVVSGGVLYTSSTPAGSGVGVSGGVLSVPGFVQVGWGSSGWGVSSSGGILSGVEEAWGYGYSFVPPVDPVESSVGSFVSGVGDYASDVFECPCEPSVGSGSVLGVEVPVSSVWDGFLVSVGGVSSGGGVVPTSGGVPLSFVEEASGVLGHVSGGGLSVVVGVGVPLWEGFVADFSGLSVTSAGFGALPFGGGSTSGGSASGDALVGCFPLSVDVCPGVGSSVVGSAGGSVGVSLVGVPVVSGVSGFGGLSVSWGLSSASLGVLSVGGGGSGWRGVLGVSGLGAGGFVPGVVGVSGGVGVGSEVVVDGVAHRGLVFGSRLASGGFVDVAGSVGVGASGSVDGVALVDVSDVEFGSVGGLGGVSPVGGRVAGLGRFAGWWLVRNWVGSVVGGVGRAAWGDVVGTISTGSGSGSSVPAGLGLGFVAGSEGYGSPVGVVNGGGSAGLFGGAVGVGAGFVGGVVDVPVGSPVVGLGVDLVDVAGFVSDLL